LGIWPKRTRPDRERASTAQRHDTSIPSCKGGQTEESRGKKLYLSEELPFCVNKGRTQWKGEETLLELLRGGQKEKERLGAAKTDREK